MLLLFVIFFLNYLIFFLFDALMGIRRDLIVSVASRTSLSTSCIFYFLFFLLQFFFWAGGIQLEILLLLASEKVVVEIFFFFLLSPNVFLFVGEKTVVVFSSSSSSSFRYTFICIFLCFFCFIILLGRKWIIVKAMCVCVYVCV